MWAPVLLENADNVIPVIEQTAERLLRMRDALATGDEQAVAQLIADGSSARISWAQARAAAAQDPGADPA